MKIRFDSHRNFIVTCGVWFFFGIFLYLYLHLFKNALIDDAFITLRYVKTLLLSGTWGFFPGFIANSATSPLNVILLTVISLFTGPTVEAALWLYLVCVMWIAFMLARLSVKMTSSAIFGWLAVFALLFNPLLISTLGLESIVFSTLFVFAIYCFQLKRWLMLAIALGLLTLTRPEGVLFLFIFLLFVPDNKPRIHMLITFILCIAPWYLFSWIHLGSFVPDTFFIKTEQRTWWEADFFNGIRIAYYYLYPFEVALSLVFLPLPLLLFSKKIRETIILIIIGLAGFVHFISYSSIGVPPFHWYYVPEITTLILFGSLGLGVLYRNNGKGWRRTVLALAAGFYFFIPALGMLYILNGDNFVVQEMPIHSNWGTLEQYKETGLWLKENHEADTMRLVAGEIGTLTYYCDCRLRDHFSDRGWLKEYIARRTSGTGIVPALLKVNFAFYSEPKFSPESYVLRAYSGEPNDDVEVIKEWQTSTAWIPHGFLIFSRE